MTQLSFYHKITARMVLLFIILALTVSACDLQGSKMGGELSGVSQAIAQPQEADSTASVWIEFPYQGQILPNEITTFVVVAADVGGVGSVSAEIDGVGLPASSMTDLSTNGSNSLVRMEVVWNPPGEGQYTLTAGAGGGGTSVTFCVVSCEGGLEQPPTDTPTPAPGITITPTLSKTPTTAPGAQTEIHFWADPDPVNAGFGTTIYWEVTGAKSVTLDGVKVQASGSKLQYLCSSKTYTLKVVAPDNTSETRSLTVSVNGRCASPTPTKSPIPQSTDTPIPPPPPADTSPPAISNLTLVWEGCSVYVQANISDPSGVSFAQSGINNTGAGWGWIWMKNIGGNTWQSEVGISISDGMTTPVGTIEFQVKSGDTLGNQTNSAVVPHPYNGCGT